MKSCWLGLLLLLPAAPAAAATIEPAAMPGLCVTIDGAEGSVSRPCDQSPAQQLDLPRGTGPIRLGARCLAPRGAGLYPPLFAEACDGSPAQQWTLAPGGEIRSAAGRCLALLGLSSRDGERVYGGACPKERPGQSWHTVAVRPRIWSPARSWLRWQGADGLCLSWIDAGSFVGLAPCNANAGSEQRFSFDRNGVTQIRSRSGCITSNAMTRGVVVTRCAAGPHAIWTVTDGGSLTDGNGLCLEPRKAGGRWIAAMARCQGTVGQRWRIAAGPCGHHPIGERPLTGNMEGSSERQR